MLLAPSPPMHGVSSGKLEDLSKAREEMVSVDNGWGTKTYSQVCHLDLGKLP